MPRYKILIEYDGAPFSGWQYQDNSPSVQRTIMTAIELFSGEKVMVQGAGRTDAGVHALGQVASCTLDRAIEPGVLARALNARLPPDVRAVSAEEVAPDFHARFRATAKTYRYRIYNADVITPFERHYAWHVFGPLDVEAMDTAARVLEGRHDFAAFQTNSGTTRTTERRVARSRVTRTNLEHTGVAVSVPGGGGHLIVYEITGDGFLRHMVRAMAGTLVEIGRGRWPIEQMREVLDSRDRGRAGPTAPACGLFLVGVEYGDL